MMNNPSKMQQMLNDKRVIEQVAKSPDARALASLLTQGQNEADLKRIAEKAAKGDTAQLSQLIQSVVNNPGGAELLRRLSGSLDQK